MYEISYLNVEKGQEDWEAIVKKVLDYYYTNGLNIVKETDDGYYVTVKERHSYKRYKDDLIILETLEENGFPPDNKYYNKKGD